MEKPKKNFQIYVPIFSVIFVILFAVLFLYGWPKYKVYSLQMRGVALLAEAEQTRQIKIQEANAEMESSKLLAAAEIERAKGVAEANRIIGTSLKNNEAYLRYLFINNLNQNSQSGQVIYIPTEAGLPILEANRLDKTE